MKSKTKILATVLLLAAVFVSSSFKQISKTNELYLSVNVYDDCTRCHGTGRCPTCHGRGSSRCSNCNGQGEIRSSCNYCGGKGQTRSGYENSDGSPIYNRCDYCNGTGTKYDNCYQCHGKGMIDCDDCRGSGDCSSCNGTGKSPY
jgi:DnaJ-class molecular chaperone